LKSKNLFKPRLDEEINLKDFDVVMYDESISRSTLSKGASALFKRRSFAFPVKLKGEASQVQARIQGCLESTLLVIQSGHDFEVRVAKTESMSIKEATKNVMHAVIKAVSLIIYAQQMTKHNRVNDVFLSTTKSLPLPIYRSEPAAQ
jgi:hypothetical protein